LCLTPPTEGFPWDDLGKILPKCQQIDSVPNGVETLRKNFNRLSRVHELYRQTIDRRTDDDIHVRSRSLKRTLTLPGGTPSASGDGVHLKLFPVNLAQKIFSPP